MRFDAGPARADVCLDAGARVASLVVDGLELLVSRRGGPLDWGLYPMAPWAGRVRRGRFSFGGVDHALPTSWKPPHAIHGTVLDRAWEQVADDAFVTSLGPDWPFPGIVRQEVALSESALSLSLEVATEAAAMPAECGWHPWWRRDLGRGRRAHLELDAGAMYVRDADGIPTGDLVDPPPPPYDDCFTGLRSSPVLRWPGALELTLDTTCDHVVVYDEPDDALCVEPQTGPPDALNLGPHVVVTPDKPLRATATWRWA